MRFNFLFSRAVGIDIADRSIEVVELAKRGGNAHIVALGRLSLPDGAIERGVIKDRPALAAALREVSERLGVYIARLHEVTDHEAAETLAAL